MMIYLTAIWLLFWSICLLVFTFEHGEFGLTSDIDNVDDVVDLAREALDSCPPDNPMRALPLAWLGLLLCHHYMHSRTMMDIEEVIVIFKELLNLFPARSPSRLVPLGILIASLCIRHEQLGTMADLDEAVALGREALEPCLQRHQDRGIFLNDLVAPVPGRRRQLINEVLAFAFEIFVLFLPPRFLRSRSLISLMSHLHTRYEQLGAMKDIQDVIFLGREVLDLHPPRHPIRPLPLNSLGSCLAIRYQQLRAPEDIDEAIALGREALSLCPQGDPNRVTYLDNLVCRLCAHYKQFGAIGDIEEAIVLSREALDLCPPGHPGRSSSLFNLGECLATRYKQLGSLEDVDEAIVLNREVLDLRTHGHPDRWMSLNNLACHHYTRYSKLGLTEDCDVSISLARKALDLCPPGHPDRSLPLMNLGECLSTRYKQLGALKDINEAIVLDREVLGLRPQGHPDRWMPLNSLAWYLFSRYNKLGVMEDFDEAIVFAREALNLCPPRHLSRALPLNNLGSCLSTRYQQLGALEDLNEAIVLGREVLEFCPLGHPDRWLSLNNLACLLSTRNKALGMMEDMNAAILLAREALNLCPPGHPSRSLPLINLGGCLSARYKELGASEDIEEAIVLNHEVLDLSPAGNPGRWMSLNNVAGCLFARYNKLGGIEDIGDAIVFAREALDLCSPGHPGRHLSLSNLACCLYARLMLSQQEEDKLFSIYAQLANMPQMVLSRDFSAARTWTLAAEKFQHPSTLLAYETSLRFLVQHLAALPTLPRHLSVLKHHTSSLAVDAFSACLRNGATTSAVELLEQGRGVFWSQLTRLRSPLDDVIASSREGKTLAEKFNRLTSFIRVALESPSGDQHDQVCHLNLELQKVVTRIRRLPGHARFLLPSQFSVLQCAAREGPVVIVNASQYSCDALVILLDQDPIHIPLQVTRDGVRHLSAELHILTERTKRVDETRKIALLLRKVWHEIVSPIVNFLRTTLPLQSRIWWCPTAEFSLLPLHAAGPYRKGQPNLDDLYVSSYTPTLTALIHARRPVHSDAGRKRFVAIGQAKAIGERELPSVGRELANISQLVQGLATFTRIEGPESCMSRVAEKLGKNQWVHLACHGLPNQKQPFESAFALYDGRFTVERIIRCNLDNPEFAYLSACHTTVGDEESPDEVIHLASAMQFAGFRSVIGTMWAVDDGETNKITSTFYKHVVDESGRLDHTRAAYALNMTMKSVNIPFDQRILYIHIGV